MATLWLCRVCLASDRKMYRLANTALEETYEWVTSKTLVVEGRPCCVCGVCLSALRRCRRFIDTAQEANDVLDRWIWNQLNTETLKLMGRPLFSFSRSMTEIFEITCEQSGIQESGVKQERDSAENENYKMLHQHNKNSGDEDNILTNKIKSEDTSSDDDNNNIECHNTQMLSNLKCINKYDNMLDIENDTQTSDDGKFDISKMLHNVGDGTAPGASNFGRSHESSDEDVPLKTLRSRKGVKLNEDTERRENNEIIHEQNKRTSDEEGKIPRKVNKYKLTRRDDTNDNTKMPDRIKSHKSQVLSNFEYTNVYDDMIDIEDYKQTLADVKFDISQRLNNAGGETTADASNDGSNQASSDEDIPLQRVRARKRVLNEDTERRENNEIIHEQNKRTSDEEGKIPRKVNKYKLTRRDDTNDNTKMPDRIKSHKSQLLSHFEYTNVYDDMIDIKDDKQTLADVKFDISQRLNNAGGETTADASNDGSNQASSDEDIPLQRVRARKRVLNEDTESGPALKIRTLITSSHRHGNTGPAAALHYEGDTFSCPHCNYNTTRKYYLKTHLKIHTGEKTFSCDKCDYTCIHKGSLKLHLLTHTDEKPFSCDKCDYKCCGKGQLKLHLLTHTGEKPFACDKCDYKFRQRGHLNRHLMTHSGEKPFACDKCDFKCIQKVDLQRHLIRHAGGKPFTGKKRLGGVKQFACNICDHRSSNKYDLNRHLFTHTGEKPFTCDICDYKCIRQISLKQHLISHTDIKPFGCDKCNYKCITKSHLTSHLKSHSKSHLIKRRHTSENKRYACDKCGYKSNQKCGLSQHLLIHTGEKLFSCDQCDYKCYLKGNLKKHLLGHTGEKTFSCDKCSYKCIRKSSLKNHSIIHTGEKRFTCDECGYKYYHKSTLKKHLLTHTSEKPFLCDNCDYKCSDKDKLKRHLLTHTGEKPFSCDKCDYKCIRKYILKKHILTHTS